MCIDNALVAFRIGKKGLAIESLRKLGDLEIEGHDDLFAIASSRNSSEGKDAILIFKLDSQLLLTGRIDTTRRDVSSSHLELMYPGPPPAESHC